MNAPFQPEIRDTILQGEARASGDDRMVMSTVLGSCVATCLYDPVARIGGMNHYLLAKPAAETTSLDRSYGLFLMELLINEMLKLGADKKRMKARIYGGANMSAGLGPIGTANAQFARQFLKDEGIPTVFEDLEGTCARRIDFRPSTGQVRARRVTNEKVPTPTPTMSITENPLGRSKDDIGGVELF
ncbi:chemotaxis protein CheD [Erythrobacter sp. SCSIO 43205]|uniref:chemotaxis protein CheD n=1 Tax=Erythrobacter sp. SCSIO 43205 TaxID=2779361 RepID=UPI001CA95DAC|nr:chemotaxis protein CheD [Erythrobacter sp. SCSIO 43205]UAB79551.1 chemotaxis protein CheD [Erythrobacter sp. SCSIO 43205]